MASIELKILSFTYPGTAEAVLQNLNLVIDAGQAHALLGASGAGKTTLLNILSGLLKPTAGQILFDGVDVSTLPGRERKVAQVFQFPVLYESLNVQQNIEFPLTQLNMSAEEVAERVKYITAELDIAPLLQSSIANLSLFEKQLVAVAKALVRPDISVVLLDEPLTAVEPRIKWRLRQALRRVKQDLGVTMVYVTHDQTEALTFADQVSVLTAAGILQSNSPEEIYNSPTHEFVGHFIGSPGMNFLEAGTQVQLPGVDMSDVDRIGFRPEWVDLGESGQLLGTVDHVKAEAVHAGQEYGLIKLALKGGSLVQLRGPITCQPGSQLSCSIRRAILFKSEQQVGVYAAPA